jgi:hypothetical protein
MGYFDVGKDTAKRIGLKANLRKAGKAGNSAGL